MATIDDISGEPGARPVYFSLDGQRYVMDLGPRNQAKIRRLLAPFIEHATPIEQLPIPDAADDRATLAWAHEPAIPPTSEPLEAPTPAVPTAQRRGPASARRSASAPRRRAKGPERATDLEIRAWAASQGLDRVPPNGRLKGDFRIAHDALLADDDGPLKALLENPKYCSKAAAPDPRSAATPPSVKKDKTRTSAGEPRTSQAS